MKTITEHIRQHLLDRAGVCIAVWQRPLPMLARTEWSSEFERLQRNRLLFGAFRYRSMTASTENKYDRIDSCQKRLKRYAETGNDELLVDVANLCMLEFEGGCHPNKHFKSVDDGEHVKTTH